MPGFRGEDFLRNSNSPSTYNWSNLKKFVKIQISIFFKTVNKLEANASDEALCQIITKSDAWFQRRRFQRNSNSPIYLWQVKFQKFVQNSNFNIFQNFEQIWDICFWWSCMTNINKFQWIVSEEKIFKEN